MDNRAFTAPGELVSANGSIYHVRHFGADGPLILLECGLTMMSSCWGWLAPGLASFSRVIAYDRAGLGWSDEREAIRDAQTIAAELDGLLRTIGVSEPLVLLGHSMGAIINRAFLRFRSGSAKALIAVDPAHPEQIFRRGIRRRMRNLLFYIEAAQLLATRAIPALEVPLVRHLNMLPEPDYRALRWFLRNPRHLKASAREARAWEASVDYLRDDTLDMPVLLLSAQKSSLPHWRDLQASLAHLSPRLKHLTFTEMSHISMLANRVHAARIVSEIRGFLDSVTL